MKILAIETSCDETAIAVLDASGDEKSASFDVLGDALYSQIEVHRAYGGVFPNLAKREHATNLAPLLEAALEDAELLWEGTQSIPNDLRERIAKILEREPGLGESFLAFISETEVPDIDVIAVTHGPGLEPALWVGVNFAKALALAWGKPLIAVNHMEGHLLAALAKRDGDRIEIGNYRLPLLGLLISGGHTELVLMKEWLRYEMMGQTRDDAVGEAFDKVARMMGLPYPGGPEISRLAEDARLMNEENPYALPRPMINSETGDFSFAGLKTAVLYLLKKEPAFAQGSGEAKKHLAREFEDAAADVLWKKTRDAIEASGANTLVIGGGVSANTHIRRVFESNMAEAYPGVEFRVPSRDLSTDNAIMIGLAGYFRALTAPPAGGFADPETLKADGNLSLG